MFTGTNTFKNDISANGNVVIYGNLTVQAVQNANIINTTVTNYQLVVTDDLSLNGRLSVKSDTNLNGNVVIVGNTTFNNFLPTSSVVPNSTYQLVNKNYVDTNLGNYLTTANAASTYLTTANATSTYQTQSGMSSYLTTANATSTYAPLSAPTFTGKSTFNGDISANGNLYVGLRSTLNGDVSMNGNLTMNGNVLIKGTLNVQQLQNANIINTTVNNYQLIVSEDLSLNGRLLVQKDANFGGNLVLSSTNGTTGFLGIGTTTPAYTLDVAGNQHTSGYGIFGNPATSSKNGAVFLNAGVGSNQSGLSIYTSFTSATAATGYAAISAIIPNVGYPALALQNGGGNVGIGTTTPAYTLDVNGTINGSNGLTIASGTISLPNSSITNTALANNSVTLGSTSVTLGTTATTVSGLTLSSATISSTTGTNTINAITALTGSTGNVGIGTTSPAYPLDVSGNVRVSNGTVTATSFNATSDYRIKDNITILDKTFSVDNLKPVTYTNTVLNKQDVGLIAHEVQEQYPYLVTGTKDGDDIQSINYNGIIGILIHEIKQLKEKKEEKEHTIEYLRIKVEDLELRLQVLENKVV